jgi:hypothetical protein
MLTKEIYKPEPKKERIARDDPRTVSELKRLDDEIVKLRTKHDKLHDSNFKKRTELNLLADKLKELHSGSYSAEASPQIKLKEGEEQLLASAGRYEEEHKLKLTQRRTSDAQTGPRRAGGTGGRAPHAPCHGLVQRQRSRAAPSVAWPAPAPLPPPADPRLTPSPLLPPGCTACCSAGTSR